MQIGVLTLWQSKDNYGQMLQCYALQQYLREKGHEPFLISYRFIKEERQYTPLWKMLLKVYVIYPLVSLLGMCVEKRQLANEEFEKYQHEKKRNFEDFLNKVREKNIEVEYNPEHKIDLKFRMAEQERWTRSRTLGWYYETPQIKKRIEQVKVLTSGRAFSHKRSRLIDTSQDKFQAAKGLERWAEIQNMKEASKVINTLTAHGVNSVDEIKQTALAEFGRRMELMKELNSMQQQIETLSEVIVNVRRVKKYQPIVDEFKMQKNDRSKKKYSSQHSEELEKYKGATAFLKEKYPDGKCPSEKSLTEKRKELIDLRAARNDEYKQLSDKLKDLDYARRTIEEYLGKSHSQKRDELE